VALPRRKLATNISFRIDQSNGLQLEELATRHGVSVHEYARGLVLEALAESDDLERVERRIEATEAQVQSLRRDLAATLLSVLVGTKEGVTDEQVREWLRRNGLLVR
jgi:hypothetical protein